MDRKPPTSTWKRVKELVGEGGVLIGISRLDRFRERPVYNWEMGFQGKDRPVRFIPVALEGLGNPKVKRASKAIERLIEQAESWIEEDAQTFEALYLDKSIARESKQLDRDKPKPQVGIKTLGKIDAHRKKNNDSKPQVT